MDYEICPAEGLGEWEVRLCGVKVEGASVVGHRADVGRTDGPSGRTLNPVPGSETATIRLPDGTLISGVPYRRNG